MLTIPQRLQEAVRRHQTGRLAEAEALYRAVLAEAPHQVHARHLLGVLAHQTGRPAEAAGLIEQALAEHGPHPVFHTNLAAVYLALGRFADAASQCQAALALQPNLTDAHNNLGIALRQLGRLDEAELAFRAALRYQPQHLDAQSNLGAVLHRQGRLPEALACLRDVVRRAPNHAQARNDLGGVLAACEQHAEAEVQLREAIRLRPDFAAAHSNLGATLDAQLRTDEALHHLHEAVRLQPTYAPAHNNLGAVFRSLGLLDEALAAFQEALRLEPYHATTVYNLSKLAAAGRYRFSDDQLRAIAPLADSPTLMPDQRAHLHYALAHVLDRGGPADDVFRHLARANELQKELRRRQGVVFDPDARRHFTDGLMAAYTPAFFEHVRGFGSDSELPIFIVGMPRSGTTLAEQILASHPRVHGAGELPDIERLVQGLPERLGGDYPACLERLDAAAARARAEGHVSRLRQLGGPAARVADKMPSNFLHLGLLAVLFPRARFVHCRRDPVDTCLSCFFQNFAEQSPFTLDLGHLGQYYREYERLMDHWARVLPVPVFDLRYEELTADQEAVSQRLLAFCGLEWDEACLRFHEGRRLVKTFSAVEVRQPMHRRSVGRWKRYEAHLQPLLAALRPVEAAD
jgi:tetratricopeptide (TPR) repeat protein